MGASRRFFVAGTDTDVGKTVITAGLLRAATRAGHTTLALKPVAAGCEREGGRLVNGDARALMREASVALDHDAVNPVALEPPIAPHIAAEAAGVSLSVETLAAHCERQLERDFDLALIEGAGGWLVPLNDRETLADLCEALATPVILVVGMRLGCLNHALLTAADLARRGVELAGWVANTIDPAMSEPDANLRSLELRLRAPCLGRVPHADGADPIELAATTLDLAPLS